MNINNTVLPTIFFYYPLGNTPPVSLTQDLPPEQSADILLLGCGDARNILFTCFVDNSRKIDVTCCDIEPGIHARNILLYTLLIDDEANRNIERIWNIYYCWKLDKNSLQLLETQTQKLLDTSESVDEWHDSVYGCSIRFCDERSLSAVRCYLSGFSSSQKQQQQSQLQNAIHRAKVFREKMIGKKFVVDITGLRSVFPVKNWKASVDISRVTDQWWDCGTVLPSNDLALKPMELNPAFLFSPNKALTLHYGLSPLHGVPLSTAYTPISKEHALCVENKGLSSTEHLINCVKSHFRQWASAFRRALANKSVLRIFAGDALAFCLTLRNCQLTQSTSMNLFCHNWTTSPLVLHDSDYVHKRNSAPLIFDVVDTSNLADHLGPLNVIALASCLLKHHAFNSLYTETLVQYDSDLAERLANFFGVDVRSMSLMFGLVPPDIFTNATNSVEEDQIIRDILKGLEDTQVTQARSRLRWKRVERCQASSNSSHLQVEANTLAKFLLQVHNAMFKHQNPSLMFKSLELDQKNIYKQANSSYNRASFAFLLGILKANVISDWNECMRNLYDGIFDDNSFVSSVDSASALDLASNLLVFGVHNALFPKPDPANLNDSILTSILPICKDIPDQLCVTVRACRERFETIATKKPAEIGSPIVICSFEGRGTEQWQYVFSSVQLVFGKWREKTESDDPYPFIEEDDAQLLGTSDMFASVMVPTSMLLQSKRFVPVVKCRFLPTVQSLLCLQELGPDLCFACNEMTSKDIFITRFMPGLSALPTFTFAHDEEGNSSSDKTEVHLSHDCSQIDSLVKRISLESEAAKTKLAMKSSTVEVDFKSPLTAVVSIAGSIKFKLQFPIPVSNFNHKIRIARKSSYIEVECRLFNPLKDEKAAFFLFPTFLMKASCNITLPVPWTSTRVNLDTMPPLDLRHKEAVSWLDFHFTQMFSVREVHIRNSEIENDIRTEIKDGLFSLFVCYTGIQGQQADCFGLSKQYNSIQTLIIPACLRLDLANYTVVLDCAIISPTEAMITSDRKAARFFQDICGTGTTQIKVSEVENRAWKALMPAFVERCRTWEHASNCEYLQAGEVPLPRGLNEDGESPICSCGIGKFPTEDYLKDKSRWLPSLSHMLKRYGTRAAISPIFAVQYVEDCGTSDLIFEQNLGKCGKCGSSKRRNAEGVHQSLLICSGCKLVKYCSTNCQKGDWKDHKPLCKTLQAR